MEIENKNDHKVIHFSVLQFIQSVLGCFLCFISERHCLVKNSKELNLVNYSVPVQCIYYAA